MLSLTTPLGSEVLRPTSFGGREALSEPFSFELELRAASNAKVPFAALLGRPVTVGLRLPGGGRRHFHGIVSRVSQGRRLRTETAYRMEVVPQFWLLKRTARSRIFQQKSVPEILATVLDDLDTSFALNRTYPPREYCVQYRESDFDFASRLMEEEGIFYFFRHSAGGHEMVIAESPDDHPPIPGPANIRFQASTTASSEPRIHEWEKTQELRATHQTLRDHHFQLPGQTLEVAASIQPSVAVGEVTHQLALPAGEVREIYDYPGRYAQRFDGVDPAGGDQHDDLDQVLPEGQRAAAIRIQEEAAASITIRGAATARNLAAGHRFTLKGHYNANGSYVLTGVSHAARESAGAGQYSNSFTCIPLGLPFRPARVTPRPAIAGVQSAVVVGPTGTEIYGDKYARVKVRFHWDRGSSADQDSSCWVRVGALHAGLEGGFAALPEVDDEVLVTFLHGDPDQPIIVGSVYNADNPPPSGAPGASG